MLQISSSVVVFALFACVFAIAVFIWRSLTITELRDKNKKLSENLAVVEARLDGRREGYLEKHIFPVASEILTALGKSNEPKTQMNALRDALQEYFGIFGVDLYESLIPELEEFGITLTVPNYASEQERVEGTYSYRLSCGEIKHMIVVVS